MITKNNVILGIIAVAAASLFIRLGMWQLARHEERTGGVETRAERMQEPLLEWTEPESVPPDTTGFLGRRARLTGEWRPESEVILHSRTLAGRAGVEVWTPFLIGGSPAHVIMVVRGWLPSADGMRPDLTSAAPPASVDPSVVEGVLISSRDGRGGQPIRVQAAGRSHLALAGLDLELLRAETSLDPIPHVLRADDPPPTAILKPARPLIEDTGPHLSYAVQWFSFALIALGGTAILILRARGR